jgi:ABC-2 type transport system ATP-binding protein
VLFSSHQLDQVEELCEQVTIIDHGRLVVSGTVDELATSGARRLLVRIEGDRTASWGRHLPGVTVSEVSGGAVRLILDDGVDSDDVLRAAMRAGRVTQFSFERRRLSEVFREALA